MLNPLSTLAELKKYLKIIALSKQALFLLENGNSVETLRVELSMRLDDCAFTLSKGTSATNPLHSVTAYLNDGKVLRGQIENAEQLVNKFIREIQNEVGPFYSKAEIERMQKHDAEKELPDDIWIPDMHSIRVQTYFDKETGVWIQADWKHGQYRTARDEKTFGPWKFFV